MQLLGDEGELSDVLLHPIVVQLLHSIEAKAGFLHGFYFEYLGLVVEEVLYTIVYIDYLQLGGGLVVV